jgi:branched-chain amino acid transport system permease protein
MVFRAPRGGRADTAGRTGAGWDGRGTAGRAAVGLGLGVAVVAALAVPWGLSGYWLRILTSTFMFAALAQSLNLIAGFAGRADFGNVLYFGLGAYATGFALQHGVPLPVAVLAGAAVAAAVAATVGLPILRLKGHYFAIATIGLMEGTRELVTNVAALGGGAGMNIPLVRIDPRVFSLVMYFVMFGLMVAYTGVAALVARGSLGYGLRALKADEEAAAAMGVNTMLAKVLAWTLSAACTAVVGGVYAVWQSFIEPRIVFDVVMGTEYFMMMLLGGPGTVAGPLVGAFALHILSVLVWSRFLHGHLAVFGVAMVLIVLFLPGGVVPTLRGLRWRAPAWAVARSAEGG